MKFIVYSRVKTKPDAEEAEDVVECTRTDRKTAESDVSILKTIMGRQAWVVECS